jgi:methylated-DNA-[protein]-cysteine S-methyltransferase
MVSPVGKLLICACPEGVTGIHFEDRWSPSMLTEDRIDGGAVALLAQARSELGAYFDGTLRTFTIPCVLEGTAFQRSVWRALRQVPFGEVTSYAAVATRIGEPNAFRAVGAANARNPVPIIIPCHRVIGSNGSLTGFGGGLPRKQWLLEHEGAVSGRLVS